MLLSKKSKLVLYFTLIFVFIMYYISDYGKYDLVFAQAKRVKFTKVQADTAIEMKELSSSLAQKSGYGIFWMNTDGILNLRDDAGNLKQLSVGSFNGYTWTLEKTGSGTVRLYIKATDTNAHSILQMHGDDYAIIDFNNGSSEAYIKRDFSNNIFTIQSGDSVYILTTRTVTSGNIHINGNITCDGSYPGSGTSQWQLNGNDLFPSSVSYTVGIGTLNPDDGSYILHVVGDSYFDGDVIIGATKQIYGQLVYDQIQIPTNSLSVMEADTNWLFKNPENTTITIDSIEVQCELDDQDIKLLESNEYGGGINVIDDITVSNDGTNRYYITETTISHATIEDDHWIGIEKPTIASTWATIILHVQYVKQEKE